MREEESFKSRLAKSFKKIGETLLKLFGGDFPVFLLFLAISFIFWWSGTMGGNYELSVQVPVNIKGVPGGVRVTQHAMSQVNVTLDGKGTALWKSKMSLRRRTLELDNSQFVRDGGRASYSTMWLIDSLTSILPSGAMVRSIQPDSLVFRYVLQRETMIPVIYEGQFDSKDQFFMERVVFTPDSVPVSVQRNDTAAHRAVARIGGVELSSDTMSMTVPLSFDSDVQPNAVEVRMTVYAQQYTEKTLEVPVTGINFPDNVILKSFPSRAVVVFWVKMSDFEKVAADDFRIVVDYNDISDSGSERAQLHVLAQPADVRNVRLQTRVVEILMETTDLR